jgi:hypothetical protein
MTETSQALEPAIADESVDDTTEDTAAPAPAVTDADEASAGKPPVQKRIDELTRLRRDAERERDYWREHAMRQNPAKPDTAEAEAPKKPPTLADFDYDETKFAEAFAKFVREETAQKVREDLRKEEAEKAERVQRESFSKREREFASKHADYEELTRDPSLPVTQIMAALAREAENGPEILYYLANHREEAERIAGMDERSAARAIGRIESKLEAPPPPPPKPVSKAPPPPPQIEAGDTAVRISTTSPDSDKLSDDEWVRAEKKRLARKVKANG